MPKNIVVCSDGTGNADIRGRGTNVFKLFEAVELRANRGPSSIGKNQVAIYHDGVGTQSFLPLKIVCGAFGLGFGLHVRELYTELSRVYEPNDSIFLFGFSRGAFAVRTLAGLIDRLGLVNTRTTSSEKEIGDRVKKAYRIYRLRYRRLKRLRPKVDTDQIDAKFKREEGVAADIAFLGVWDTVAALGFPFDEGVANFWNSVIFPYRFPNNHLPSNVRCARQALAIDEERRAFAPELWNESERDVPDSVPDRIRQVWFPGVHSNVGGGYPKQGLSLVALAWVLGEAMDKGLHVVGCAGHLFTQLQNATDKLYDSRAGLAGYYAYKPRDIEAICNRHNAAVQIHVSAFERAALGTCGYSPGNIPRRFEVVAEPGVRAQEVARIVAEAHEDRKRQMHLQAGRRWIPVWRTAQAVFVFATIWLVVLCIRTFGLEVPFDALQCWIASAVLLVSLLMCYIACGVMEKNYSQFWFGVRRKLRAALGLIEPGPPSPQPSLPATADAVHR